MRLLNSDMRRYIVVLSQGGRHSVRGYSCERDESKGLLCISQGLDDTVRTACFSLNRVVAFYEENDERLTVSIPEVPAESAFEEYVTDLMRRMEDPLRGEPQI